MNYLLKQKISNSPIFEDVERFVIVKNVALQPQFSQIIIDAEMKFEKDGVCISDKMNTQIKDWVVNNNDFTTVRDERGNPIPNPHFVELAENEEDMREAHQKERHMKMPSFDYFHAIITNPQAPSLINILSMHIAENDKIGFFD